MKIKKSIHINQQTIYPSKIICVGRNYVEHIHELGNEIPEEMVLFLKPNSAIANQLISFHEEQLHYEVEIVFIVSDRQFFGVGVGVDLTKRKLQSTLKAKGLPWERSKAFDGSAIFSEFVQFDQPMETLEATLHINGKLTQQAKTKFMIYSPQQILAEVQKTFSLQDGDVIMTGTPKGVGKVNSGDCFEVKLLSEQHELIHQTWIAQ